MKTLEEVTRHTEQAVVEIGRRVLTVEFKRGGDKTARFRLTAGQP